jgi:OFA family oxalate/formate antiporter-like MFS transporter
MIDSDGYQHAFLFFGLFQGAIVFVLAWLLLVPPAQLANAVVKPNQTAHGYTPTEVLRTPVFYVMYIMFVLIAVGGLTMTASIVPIADDFKISKIPVALFGYVLPAAVFAVQLNRIFDGFGRPFFGWLSDRIGREHTMALAFLIGAAALFTLKQSGSNPLVFVLVTALYFGVFGEIYSLFPATQGDTFGAKYAASNAGMLYTAKGTAALLVPVAAYVSKSYGWGAVFTITMSFNIIAGLMALFVLKPMRTRHFATSRVKYAAESPASVVRGARTT